MLEKNILQNSLFKALYLDRLFEITIINTFISVDEISKFISEICSCKVCFSICFAFVLGFEYKWLLLEGLFFQWKIFIPVDFSLEHPSLMVSPWKITPTRLKRAVAIDRMESYECKPVGLGRCVVQALYESNLADQRGTSEYNCWKFLSRS